ncbi:ABC transporter ATP-binding protein/permease [Methylocystis sp. ATCC 49242]|uniref:ABC transporter ATP-binding protein/permease n=1 Tax=Methylocystis sp. ATCC 49242 TaxID=622637 RepID=UPI0001F871BC|nr:ABC transporter ATP-binding protein/permease [Methylocystis sp. ATCC 49242]
MTNRNGKAPRSTDQQTPINGFAPYLGMILVALRAARERVALYWLGGGLLLVIAATAYGQIRLNAWNQPFYDALARKDLAAIGEQLLVFTGIAITLLILNVSQTWLVQMTKLKLREGLTRDLFAQWLTPKRAFLIARSGEIGVNPDQRIHADAQHLAEVSTDLGVGLVQASLLLVSFVGVLWTLSEGVTFSLLGAHIDIPGYMVWCALLYAALASLASWRVGRPLVHLGAERYARESEMRFALMHVNAHGEAIAIHRGEEAEQARLRIEFDRLLDVLRQLVTATTNLAWVTAGYGWFTIVAPIIVAAPAYFAGNLTFGGLLMAVGAFTQAQQSLRWFVDNAGVIADWRATLFRVGSFRQALLDIDASAPDAARITFTSTSRDRLLLENLELYSPSGSTRLDESHIEIAPQDHVLVIGEHGSGKTLLFRAIAGLWTSGRGNISLPPANAVYFVPKRPYIADLALRDILSYPASSSDFSDEEYVAVLTRFGLAHLAGQLNRIPHWEKELTDAEQQGLAFARVLLHKPRFVIVDEAIESLSPEARRTLFKVFADELAHAALVYINGPQAQDRFFDRVLHLNLTPRGERQTVVKGSA